MEPETVLYFITGVVILTFIAFCYACYCTCKEMKLKSHSPSPSSTSSRAFWSGNSNTVMALHPNLRRQATQRFRQMSWRTLMQRTHQQRTDRSPSTSSAFPLISLNSQSFDSNRPGTANFITVFYERNSRDVPSSATMLAPPTPAHMSFNIPTNCLLHSNHSRPVPESPPPPYDEAVRLSTVLIEK